MNRRNRRFPSFFDIDDMLGLDIQRIMDEMDAVMENHTNDPDFASRKPIYYGYSVEVGPDGRPRIKEWGNVRPNEERSECGCNSCQQPAEPQRDPIDPPCEVIVEKDGEDGDGPYTCSMFDEKNNELKIHADIPGVSRDDIDLELVDGKLVLNARTESRYYHKEIPLDYEVTSGDIKAHYNNGLLEITLKCKEHINPKKAEKIEIE